MFYKSVLSTSVKSCCLYQQIRHATVLKKYKYISLKNKNLRREKGLSGNPNASGVLTDSPDYSFLDGRMTPLGIGQRKRLLKNEEAKLKIIALSNEIDFAVERYKKIQEEEKNKRENILASKLKPKGAALLQSERS
ncbi:large ribosomal subunit protein mL52 [Euwallacea fornicatus]|uniref:large ribosomal subunit protein mL52 n=1 Tax=Euwallacea fornicatus TaxID=995702 RepID=UPI0033901FDB